MAKTKILFNPHATEPMPLSRSKIDLFLQCPRCFYLDRKLGISRPSGAPFTLNITVDALLKKEFDVHRKNKTIHHFLIENGIDAIPFDHPDIEIWRNNWRGIRYYHESTNFEIYGAIDDVWITPAEDLIIVDYKAKSSSDDPSTFLVQKTKKTGEIIKTERYKNSYKKQIEMYQWLFRKNGFKVSNQAYFLFANAQKEKEIFHDRLDFEKHLITYEGSDGWVEPAILSVYECLNKESLPEWNIECDYCKYRRNTQEVEF